MKKSHRLSAMHHTRHAPCQPTSRTLLAIIFAAGGVSLATGATSAERHHLGAYAAVTANPLATSAAVRMLKDGGSAVDAAIAAQLVLGVVEPQSSGIGGGAVVLYREPARGPVRAFDGLARSPGAYDAQSSLKKGFSHSGAAVGVPGSVRLMGLLHTRYGRLPWGTLFEPAIQIASSGFRILPYLGRSLTAAIRGGFAPPPWLQDSSGAPLAIGALVRNEELAAAMQEIAQKGPDGFYVHLAPEIVSAVRESSIPGAMTEDDVAHYAAVERSPLCEKYAQIHVCTFPPPSFGGVVVLEMLELLDQLHAGPPNFLSASFVHTFVEAGRIAQADRLRSIGDPEQETVATAPLLSRSHISQRAMLIDPHHVLKNPPPGIGDGASCANDADPPPPSTSQIAIVDRWGGALSMTTTINVNFGAWLPVRGFFLNDAMTNFTRPSDSPCTANRPAGNKRPETSMAPVIVMDRTAQTTLLGGSAGGGEIVDYVAQSLLELAYGRSPLEALDSGHVSTARSPYLNTLGLVELEEGRSVASLATKLEALGHAVKVVPLPSGLGFLKWEHGAWVGAADPRRDGDWVGGR
jgi:gamma-glutamyltranspeptidase / glutathione hydrolase